MVQIVEHNRHINFSKLPLYVRESGVITGAQAIKYGLADSTGTIFTAIKYAEQHYCHNSCSVEYLSVVI